MKNKKLKIGLLAADDVGLETAKIFRKKSKVIDILILDSRDSKKKRFNSKIIKASGIKNSENIIYSAQLSSKSIQKKVRESGLDLLISAWWPYIIKPDLYQLPRLGTLNFHPSYLPFNRGKHYSFWNIVEQVPFGVTIHWINAGVDSGDIAFQKRIETCWTDTGESLQLKAKREVIQLFKNNFRKIITGNIPKSKQKLKSGSYHHSKEILDASKIVLNKKYKAKDLINILRAKTHSLYSGAWFKDKGKTYEIKIQIKEKD